MRHRHDPSPELLALAEAQAYTLSRRQCLRHGLGPDVIARLIHTQWRVITPGIYAIHPLPISWLSRAWTGVLIGGNGAMLGGWSAAHLAGFAPEPQRIQVWVNKTPPRPRPGIFFRRNTLGRTAGGESPPRSAVAETVLDICERATTDGIAGIIAGACNHTSLGIAELRHALEARSTLTQRALIRDCLDSAAAGAESALERRYLVEVERPHGLPPARRQAWTTQSSRVDALIAEYGLAIELDGRKGHLGTGAFRDLARDNRHQSLGLVTLRYGWDDVVGSPCETARQIAAVLQQRGWPGPLLNCPRCQALPMAG